MADGCLAAIDVRSVTFWYMGCTPTDPLQTLWARSRIGAAAALQGHYTPWVVEVVFPTPEWGHGTTFR